MRFFKDTHIDFLGKKNYFFGVSLLLVAISIGTLFTHGGPVLGIDFTGGTFLQVGFHDGLPKLEEVRDALSSKGIEGFTLQTQPGDDSIIIRVNQGEKSKDDIAQELISALKDRFPKQVNEIPERIEFVGPVIGEKLIGETLWAILGSLALIVIYIAFRFKKWVWGIGGVLALAHDVFITIGYLTVTETEVTLVVIAALLTLAGYSINDTIVIFDRVRENLRVARKEKPTEIFNKSINETLGRTVNTSLTTLLAAGTLLVFGGEVIHDFALTLVFGIVLGTYSSVGVALAFVHQLQYGKK